MGNSFRLAMSPLSWTNDVLEDLGGDTPVEVCLADIQAAGFAGTELGRKYPRDPHSLGRLLDAHRLRLASGWYSGFLADRDVAAELQAVQDHARLLHSLGAEVMVYGECGRMVPDQPLDAGLSRRLTLGRQEWGGYAARITEFAARLQERHGLRLAYHHHLMMVAETFDELSALFDRTGPEAGLLLDLGHATAAGFDYNRVIERFGDRIVHIHLKDVRTAVLAQVRIRDLSFNEGVRRGLFAVPGQGQVDYAGIIRYVHATGYSGWLVVEAEQDPALAPPRQMADAAYAFLTSRF